MLAALLLLVPLSGAAAIAAGFVYQQWGLRKDAQLHPPPGQIVSIGGRQVHSRTIGQGSPAVVLESGLAGSSLSWAPVQTAISAFTTVCAYDRAGYGWSGAYRTPRTIENVVSDLYLLLAHSEFRSPYVLVGHSYGGLVVRAFVHFYPDLVAGVILVDPVSTGFWADATDAERRRLHYGSRLARRGALMASVGIIRLVLALVVAKRRKVPGLLAKLSARGAESFLMRLAGEMRKLPPSLWPKVRAQWSRSMGFRTIAAYLDLLPESARFVERNSFLCPKPLTIISASTATPAELKERDRWVSQSCSGKHVRLAETGHWIQVERPEAVITEITAMVKKAISTSTT